MVVPPIVEEIRSLPADLHRFYMYLRQAMGPFAQGPVALIARHTDECVFSADALGLRPLWQVETEATTSSSAPSPASSRSARWSPSRSRSPPARRRWSRSTASASARPCTPTTRCCGIVRDRWLARNGAAEPAAYDRALQAGGPLEGADVPGYSDAGPEEPVKVDDRVLAGFGWQRDDVKLVQQMASNGAEPIGSLGYDGPLAALSPERQNLADYFKETVAVVTNPAIDREREVEHFSTRAVFGRRPSIGAAGEDTATVETSFPVILGGHHGLAPLSESAYREIARDQGTYLLEDLWEEFRGRAGAVDISLLESETTKGAIERIKQEAVKKVRDGAELLVLTDRTVYDAERRYLDPHLATSAVDQALKQFRVEPGEENLRRRCGIVLRSAAIRNVHDTMLALGLGANGVCPYTMVEVICVEDYEADVAQPLRGARQGDRESDLDDRHPRGARLRPPVLLDRGAAGAGRDLPDRGLRRLGVGRCRLRRPRRGLATRGRGSWPATKTPNRRRRSASTPRSTRPRSRPPTARAPTRSTRRRCASWSARARSRCATSWV